MELEWHFETRRAYARLDRGHCLLYMSCQRDKTDALAVNEFRRVATPQKRVGSTILLDVVDSTVVEQRCSRVNIRDMRAQLREAFEECSAV